MSEEHVVGQGTPLKNTASGGTRIYWLTVGPDESGEGAGMASVDRETYYLYRALSEVIRSEIHKALSKEATQ